MPAKKKNMTNRVQRDSSDEVVLGVRCERDLRESFVKACFDLDTNASREVRIFMRSFLAKNGQERLL